MAVTERIACPHCDSRIDPANVPDADGLQSDEARLKGGSVECTDCGDDFDLYFY